MNDAIQTSESNWWQRFLCRFRHDYFWVIETQPHILTVETEVSIYGVCRACGHTTEKNTWQTKTHMSLEKPLRAQRFVV